MSFDQLPAVTVSASGACHLARLCEERPAQICRAPGRRKCASGIFPGGTFGDMSGHLRAEELFSRCDKLRQTATPDSGYPTPRRSAMIEDWVQCGVCQPSVSAAMGNF